MPRLGFTGIEFSYECGFRALERVYLLPSHRVWDVFEGHVFRMTCTSRPLAELWIHNTIRLGLIRPADPV